MSAHGADAALVRWEGKLRATAWESFSILGGRRLFSPGLLPRRLRRVRSHSFFKVIDIPPPSRKYCVSSAGLEFTALS